MAKSTVAVRFTGDVAALKRATGDAEGTLGGFAKKAGGLLKSGLVAAGVTAAAALAKGFSDALSQDRSVDKAAASLGLSPEESAKLGKVAGKLYADAYGESFGEVADAVASVKSELGDLNDTDLESATAHALNFAEVFDQDVNESITAAGSLLRNGLVEDGEEAFDLLTATMQDVPKAAREEVLAATEEYSTFFSDLGLSGQEAFGAIAMAAEEGGRFGVDKLGDAMKEFGIRATDMSTASTDAFDTIGMDAGEMGRRIIAGGDDARDAFYDIVTALRGVEDPLEQSKAAIALFGTPLEDLSSGEIPEFLSNLDSMGDALGDVEGRAGEMGDTLNNNVATKIEAFKRKGFQALANFVGNVVIPAIERFAPVVEEVVDDVSEFVSNLVAVFRDWSSSVDTESGKVGEIIQRVRVIVTSVFEAIRVAIDTWTKVVTEIWRRFGDDFLSFASDTFANVAQVIEGVLQFIQGILDVFIGVFTGDWSRAWEGIKGIVSGATRAIHGVIKQALNGLKALFRLALANISAAWSVAWNSVKTFAHDAWMGIKSNIGGHAQNVVDFMRRLPDRLLRALGNLAGLLYAAGKQLMNGLLDGIKAGFGGVADFVGGIAGKIAGLKGPLPYDRTVLVDNGLALMDGLNSGIKRGLQDVYSTVGGIAPSLAMAPVGAGTGGGGPQVIQLTVDGRVLASVVNDHNADRDRRNGRR